MMRQCAGVCWSPFGREEWLQQWPELLSVSLAALAPLAAIRELLPVGGRATSSKWERRCFSLASSRFLLTSCRRPSVGLEQRPVSSGQWSVVSAEAERGGALRGRRHLARSWPLAPLLLLTCWAPSARAALKRGRNLARVELS